MNRNSSNNRKRKSPVAAVKPTSKKPRNIIYANSIDHLPPPDPPEVNLELLEQYETDQHDEIAAHYNYLKTKYRVGTKISYYHLRLKDISLNIKEIENFVTNVYKIQKTAFKIQISFSVLLQHRETKEFRVFLGHINSMTAFPDPITVSSWPDLVNVLNRIEENDLHELATLQRPNTQYVIIGFLTAQISIFKFSNNFAVIGSFKKLPDYLKNNKNILCYTYEKEMENNCLFCCIAGSYLGYKKLGIMKKTLELKHQWEKYKGINGNFDGRVSLLELDDIERCFNLRINVYKLVPCKQHKPTNKTKKHRVETVRLSGYGRKTTPVISLDYYAKGQHFSLIKNLKNYISVFKCNDCGFLASKEFLLKKHLLRANKCTETKDPKPKFLGGSFGNQNLTIWQKLELRGLKVGDEKFNSGFSIWDFESITQKNQINCGKSLILEGTLVPISCAICSTDADFRKPKFFFIDTDAAELIDRILDYLIKVQEAAYLKRRQELDWIFIKIDDISYNLCHKLDGNPDQEIVDYIEKEVGIWKQLREELDRHCSEHTIFGWNSAKFDINLIRSELFSGFKRKKLEFSYMVKRQTSYAYIKAGSLVFRDAQHLVSAGISLKNFLLSQKQDDTPDFQGKLIFPHDWLQDLNQLRNQTYFPEKSCFYSKLRNENVTDSEYEESKKLYVSQKCKNMLNWLEIYNIADCYELRNAMERLKTFWQNLGFSILFDGMSLSGLAEKVLHGSIDEPYHLWIPTNNRDKVIYDEINKSIVGGPSIVFHRKCIRNETVIGQKTVQHVLGLDQNSLYLGCLGSEMPTGIPAVYNLNENGFFSKTMHLPRGSSLGEYRFCFWLQYRKQLKNLIHAFNYGQVQIGNLKPDACDLENKIVYQYYGCYIHGHESCTLYDETKVNKEELKKKRENRIRTENDYHKLGFGIKYIYECQFKERIWKIDMEFRRWFNKHFMVPFQWQQKNLTLTKLLSLVQEGKMFGLLCNVTIDVPKHLEEKFETFCPIFYHAEISRDDVGDFMKEYLTSTGKLTKPRRTLISGMHGKGLNLTTPLVKFYLDQGLEISKATRFIQWLPKKIFKPFTELVTEKRRAAEVDNKQKIIGENMKLIGNGAYGRSLLKKQDYVKYLLINEKSVHLKVNNERFKSAEQFEMGDVYEIGMNPRFYRETTARHIGAFVLAQAKLEMLKFYYSFWDKFMDKNRYQLCQMDTDSLYMAITENSIIDLVKPGMMEEFLTEQNKWMVNPCLPGDSKTPLKMKIEFWGTSIVALCPKMYYTWTLTENEFIKGVEDIKSNETLTEIEKTSEIEKLEKRVLNVKSAMKGTNKKLNKLTEHDYLTVIEEQKTIYGHNRGFRLGGVARGVPSVPWHTFDFGKVKKFFKICQNIYNYNTILTHCDKPTVTD